MERRSKIIGNITGRNWVKLLSGIAAGSMIGYGYYFFIGCNSGSCAITGDPLNSTIYGAVVGLVWMFPTRKRR